MASTNQSPQYQKAESKFLSAQTPDEKITYLEEMIRECPKHKSSEKMLANLKTRLKKLLEQREKQKRSGKSHSGKSTIKKEDMQVAIIGFTGAGKSSILKILTNATPKISETKFTTTKPIQGILHYKDANIQLVEIPSVESDYFDKGIVNTADVILIIAKSIEEIPLVEKYLDKAKGKKLVALNKSEFLSNEEKRKISATLQSKKYNFILTSANLSNPKNLEELKEKILQSFDKLRVYTKPYGSKNKKSKKPIIMKPDSTVKDVAEKILHGFSDQIKQTKIWGPSSKFPGQTVGLNHKLKDLDVVEFKTR